MDSNLPREEDGAYLKKTTGPNVITSPESPNLGLIPNLVMVSTLTRNTV